MKIFYLFIAIFTLFTSCSTEDAEMQYFLELLPVEKIELPSEFQVNTSHAIPVYYKIPTTCHAYDSFYFEKVDHTRTIAVQCIKVVKQDCATADQTPISAILNFKPTEVGMLTFKIWKGKNTAGIDVYEEFEVPVIE